MLFVLPVGLAKLDRWLAEPCAIFFTGEPSDEVGSDTIGPFGGDDDGRVYAAC